MAVKTQKTKITSSVAPFTIYKNSKNIERTLFWWAKIKTRTLSKNVKIDPQEYFLQGFSPFLIPSGVRLYKISHKSNNLDGSNGVEPDHSNGEWGGTAPTWFTILQIPHLP